ncbi:hypothetical protein Acr_28g0010780 [Actinidia rufa]|uniref:Transmembrane protein n=1 Tax=Actinidia rufa TaxID=165716 RepID=A0A7J0HBA5_9ERIC|nr:hypothetical protein Acr_28g0010780 [Actinidia rufa]
MAFVESKQGSSFSGLRTHRENHRSCPPLHWKHPSVLLDREIRCFDVGFPLCCGFISLHALLPPTLHGFRSSGLLVTASLNQALTLFGLRSIYTWLVLFACFVMVALRVFVSTMV